MKPEYQRDDLLDRVLADMREKLERQIAFLRSRGYPDQVIFEAYRIESREADASLLQ